MTAVTREMCPLNVEKTQRPKLPGTALPPLLYPHFFLPPSSAWQRLADAKARFPGVFQKASHTQTQTHTQTHTLLRYADAERDEGL